MSAHSANRLTDNAAQLPAQEIECVDRSLGRLGMGFGELIILAEQEVLLVATQLEQLDEDGLGRRPGVGGVR